MTKKLIILFVAMGVTYISQAQGYSRGLASLTDTPAAAFSTQTPPAFALRTNLIYWASIVPQITPNGGIEVGLSQKMTFNFTGAYNWFGLKGTDDSNKKLVHWIVEPEVKYWFCERFNGSAVGVHAIYSKYNVGQYHIPLLFDGDKDIPNDKGSNHRYEGSAVGGGVSYNYHWMVGKRFGVEFTLGAGFLMMQYDRYNCPSCGNHEGIYKKTYLGPTKIGINLVYLIK